MIPHACGVAGNTNINAASSLQPGASASDLPMQTVPGDWERTKDLLQYQRMMFRTKVSIIPPNTLLLRLIRKAQMWEVNGNHTKPKQALHINPGPQMGTIWAW